MSMIEVELLSREGNVAVIKMTDRKFPGIFIQGDTLATIKQLFDVSGEPQKQLAPIGFGYHDHLLLMYAEDGRFFGGFDDEFGLLGSSMVEMIQRWLDGKGSFLSSAVSGIARMKGG